MISLFLNNPVSVIKRLKANGKKLMSDFRRSSLQMDWLQLHICRITNESTVTKKKLNGELRWHMIFRDT